MRLAGEAIAALASNAGLDTAEKVTIALAISGWNGSPEPGESGGDPSAFNAGDASSNGKWTGSFGLWQVRALSADRGTGRSRDETKLTDPSFNADSMVAISSGGTNWQPWAVYTSGKYLANMEAARQIVTGDRDGITIPGPGPLPSIYLPSPGSLPVPGIDFGISSIRNIASLVGVILTADFWKRVGLGAVGVGFLVLAALFVFGGHAAELVGLE